MGKGTPSHMSVLKKSPLSKVFVIFSEKPCRVLEMPMSQYITVSRWMPSPKSLLNFSKCPFGRVDLRGL